MARKTATLYVGTDARQHAQRHAVSGRREWLVWTTRQRQRCGAPLTRPALKAALLAHGTQIREGDLLLIHAGCGSAHVLDWGDAIRTWSNLRWLP